jgi:hypothetical protein
MRVRVTTAILGAISKQSHIASDTCARAWQGCAKTIRRYASTRPSWPASLVFKARATLISLTAWAIWLMMFSRTIYLNKYVPQITVSPINYHDLDVPTREPP